MKKNLNKLATLALTGMMVAGMSFGAMAATAPTENAWENKSTTPAVDGSFSFNKYLEMEETYTSVPHVKFAFSTEVVDKTKDAESTTFESPKQIANTGTDSTLPVYYGPAGLTATVEFGSKNDDDSDNLNKTVTFKEGDKEVTGSTFKKSGIYRFALADETLSNDAMNDLYKNGESTSFKLNTNQVKYMDVYVVNEEEKNTFKISNVVLMSSVPKDGIKSDKGAVDYSTAKLSGIDNGYTTKHGDGKENKISIEKKLAGSIQNESEEFTFKVYFTNVTSDFKVKTVYSKNETAETNKNGTDGKGNVITVTTEDSEHFITVALVGDEKVEITGLPVGIKYKVAETENGNYTPSIKLNEDGNVDENGGTDKDAWTLDERTLSSTLEDNIEWTNTRKDITVTGVAVNIAPYAAMVLGAGAFAGIFLGGKRRKAEDED